MRIVLMRYFNLKCASIMSLLMILASGVLTMPVISKAESGLNANEQEIIAYMEHGISYNGRHYNVPKKYINQGINYLKQAGVELTKEQKDKFYHKTNSLLASGVEKGYLRAAEKDTSKRTKNTEPTASDPASIQEIVLSANEVSKEIGLKVSYDVQKEQVNVVNQAGRTIINSDVEIKNTGYRLNQSFGVCTAVIAVFGICMHVIFQYRLFDSEDE